MKNPMKKLVLSGLVLIMCFALAACGQQSATNSGESAQATKTAYETYKAASDKQQTVQSIEMDLFSTINMETQGESFAIELQGSVQEVLLSKTDIQMAAQISTLILGQQVIAETWFKDGYLYSQSGNVKFKTAMSIEDALSQSNAQLAEFDEGAIKEQNISDGSDGSKIVNFVLDGKAMAKFAEQASANIAQTLSDSTITLGDVTVKAVIDKDGQLASVNISFVMDITISGETVKTTYDMKMDNYVYDKAVINFPADLDAYQEMSLAATS